MSASQRCPHERCSRLASPHEPRHDFCDALQSSLGIFTLLPAPIVQERRQIYELFDLSQTASDPWCTAKRQNHQR
jgi:hypothetical protein